MQYNVKIFENIKEMNNFLYEKWQIWQKKAILDHGIFSVALSGGNTPIPFYSMLADMGMEEGWDNTFFFMVDERFVTPGHKDHNFSNIKKNLFDKIDIPSKNIFPIDSSLESSQISVKEYEATLKKFFANNNNHKINEPILDLIILGMGEDGHTASLFPGTEVLKEKKASVGFCNPETAPHERITLTYPIINMAHNIVFIITGENKADIVKEVIEKHNPAYPASLVKPAHDGNVWYLLDKDAASQL